MDVFFILILLMGMFTFLLYMLGLCSQIDGQKKNLPLTLGNGSLNLYSSGSNVVLDTTFGLLLQYDWHHHLQVQVGPELYGSLCGLCGNANRNAADDFTTPDGTEVIEAVDFSRHWRVDGDTGLCTDDSGGEASYSKSTAKWSESLPGMLKDSSKVTGYTLSSDGPFAECHSHVDPEPFVGTCTTDLCVANGASSAICRAMKAYADICQRLGVSIRPWRGITKCRECIIFCLT